MDGAERLESSLGMVPGRDEYADMCLPIKEMELGVIRIQQKLEEKEKEIADLKARERITRCPTAEYTYYYVEIDHEE